MLENKFQSILVADLKSILPGCIVLKTDSSYLPGFPDLVILYRKHWIALECKKSCDEPYRPNQEYYLELSNSMSFARVIYPENKEAVLNELQQTFRPNRPTRISWC